MLDASPCKAYNTSMHQASAPPARKLSIRAIVSFFATLMLCFSLVFVMVFNRYQVERLTMEQLITEKGIRINNTMSRLLSSVHSLSAHVQHSNGEVSEFGQLASMLIDDPAIINMLIAPDGVVSEVYPLEGNEAVLGIDFLSETAGCAEAILALETRQLVLGGPFQGVLDRQIMVGRLPVFIDEPDGTERFWGIVSVTLAHPQALYGVGLGDLNILGFDYEIWRVNPDTCEMQIIASSDHYRHGNIRYIEKPVSILNATWYFRILAVRAWYEFPETWISIIVSIFVSIMVAVVVQHNRDLRKLRDKLGVLSNTDPLTGVHNRRYFMEAATGQMERANRHDSESFIIILDLDHFKAVNDKYGHQSGDMVLQEVALRVTAVMRPYDLFARYGGEEFILFVMDMDRESAVRLAERIRLGIAATLIKMVDASTEVTVSLGVAQATPVSKLEKAIANADKALYRAKNEGRNRVVFH